MTVYRGGWPYRHPPNAPFVLNTESPQARGLYYWFPVIGWSGGNKLVDRIRGNSFALTTGWSWKQGRVEFDGTEGADADSAFNPGTNDFTISFWVRKLSTTTGFSNLWGLTQYVSGATGDWAFTVGDGTGGENDSPGFGIRTDDYYRASGNEISLGVDYLFVGIRRGTDIYFYINGKQEDTIAIGAGAVTSGQTLRIADWDNDTLQTHAQFWDIRLYNGRAFSDAEILHQYNNPWDLYRPIIPQVLGKGILPTPPSPDEKLPDKIRIIRSNQLPIHQLQL